MRAVIGSASMPVSASLSPSAFGSQGEEQAGAAARLQNSAAGKAHPQQRPPDGADDEFRRVVRILRGPRETREILPRDELLQLEDQILPAGANSSPARRNSVLASSDAPKPVNFASRSCSQPWAGRPSGLDLRQQPDGGKIVGRPALPAVGQVAIANQPIVLRRHGRRSGR